MKPFQKRHITPEQIAAARPCGHCRHFLRDEKWCKEHDRAAEPKGNCPQWNRFHWARGKSRDKYSIRSIPEKAWSYPLVQSALAIATKRGLLKHSARWWEVFHIAHQMLCQAHMAGQRAAFRRLVGVVESLLPETDAIGRDTPAGAAQREVLDALIAQCRSLEAKQPEPPTT